MDPSGTPTQRLTFHPGNLSKSRLFFVLQPSDSPELSGESCKDFSLVSTALMGSRDPPAFLCLGRYSPGEGDSPNSLSECQRLW